jgi:hypothetical protein
VAGRDTVCSTIALENRAELARRDTIGTLATLTIDIIILFSLRHCYGGAPREVPFATGQAAPQGAEVAPRTRDKTKECPVGAPSTPRSGAMQEEDADAEGRRGIEKREGCCLKKETTA